MSPRAVPVTGHEGVVAAVGLLAPPTSPRLPSAMPHLRAAGAAVGADFLRRGLGVAAGEGRA
jgi:hypothetical protein